jgi:large exoprotein involved in heme utilization and adhesion
VTINARDTVAFDGVGSDGRNSAALSRVLPEAVGKGGEIRITTGSLFVTNGAQLEVSTAGKGNAGVVTINARDTVTFDGESSNGFISTARSRVESTAVGKGGDINITTGSLSVTNGAFLTASTLGRGDAGNVFVQAKDFVSLADATIFSSVENGRGGNGGDINVTTGSLFLTNGAQLVATSRGPNINITGVSPINFVQLLARVFGGNAGNIQINATDAVSISGANSITGDSSGLFTNTNSIGKGGNITVNTSALRVSDGAVLDARTNNFGNGGNITVNARLIETINGGQLIATSSNSGRAGKITVNASDRVIVNGSDATFSERVAKFGERVANPEAASGFFVRSLSSGAAGDIEVTTPQIRLDNGARFNAESASGNGGNINLRVGDLLLLRGGSFISATAGTAQQGGDGGNITINAPSGFIVSAPNENSDITANAFNGSGGRININSLGIFNFTQRTREDLVRELRTDNPNQLNPQQLQTNDITAFSLTNPTLSGQIIINTPDVDPSKGFVELPTVSRPKTSAIAL